MSGSKGRMTSLPSRGAGFGGLRASQHPPPPAQDPPGLCMTAGKPHISGCTEDPFGSLGSAGGDSRASADKKRSSWALLVAFLPNIQDRGVQRHLMFCLFVYMMLFWFSLLLDKLKSSELAVWGQSPSFSSPSLCDFSETQISHL